MCTTRKIQALVLVLVFLSNGVYADIWDEVEHGFADNGDVSIHYATIGEGPLVIMIHGFPDFWYSWRDQMDALRDSYKVVAIDQRGYNRSSQPQGNTSYNMEYLTSDVAAVIRHFGEESAIVAGHDWGGIVAWQFAFAYPAMVNKLIVLDMPHPNGLARELATNEEQYTNSEYARTFINGSPEDSDIFFGNPMTSQTLSGWVTDPAARSRYVDAFERSDFTGMLAYYKQNYPRVDSTTPLPDPAPQLDVPLLVIHGLQDIFLNSDGLNNTWDWNDATTTILAIPNAGHFVQQDAPELVSNTIRFWLIANP